MPHTKPLEQPKRSLEEKLISVGLWVDDTIPLDEAARKARDMGYNAVEIHGFGPACDPFRFHLANDDKDSPSATTIDMDAAEELAGKIADLDLVVSGFAGNFHQDGITMTTDDGAKQYFKLFKQLADYSKVMGAKMIRVDGIEPAGEMVGKNESEIIDRMGRTWAKCANYAQNQGQYITMEFEPEFLGSRPSQIVAISDAVKKYASERTNMAKTWGILYDTCHGETVGIEGHKQYNRDGPLTGDARETFESQEKFITYLVTKGVNINHLHIIGSDGTLHDKKTSMHVPIRAQAGDWAEPGVDRLQYDSLLPHLLENTNLKQNIWTVDTCFRKEGMKEAEKCLEHMREFTTQYKSVEYKPVAPTAK